MKYNIHTHFLMMLVGIIFLVTVLVTLQSSPQAPTQAAINQLIASARVEIHPESIERFVFALLAVLVPLAAFAWTLFAALSPSNGNRGVTTQKGLSFGYYAPAICVSLLFIPFVGSELLAVVLGTMYRGPPFIVLISSTFLVWQFRERLTSVAKVRVGILNSWLWGAFVGCILLQNLSWRLLGLNSIHDTNAQWTIHFDAVVYALSQVVAGKTILADLPSQYGLWPEIVAPALKLTGLSVLGLTSAFAVLQLLSLAAVFFVLLRLTKLPVFKIAGGMALVLCTFGTPLLFGDAPDPYFQYWPLRFLWPAISVFLFYKFTSKKSLWRSAVVSVAAAVGALWNLDTGLFIIVSFGAFLLAKMVAVWLVSHARQLGDHGQWQSKKYGVAALLHAGITMVVIALFLTALQSKATVQLNWGWLFKYQSIFYELGFMMMPLPITPEPWMVILAVYLFGILCAVRQWTTHSSTARMDTVFYLSILGLGLFIYYQGRSHVLNLLSVSWPALVVAIILSDEAIRGVKARLLPPNFSYLPVLVMTVLSICCLSFLMNAWMMVGRVGDSYKTRNIPTASYVANEIEFIQSHSTHNHECLILAKRQGIDYVETGLASPVKGPGLIEIILVEDRDRLRQQVLDGDVDCLFLGLGVHSSPDLDLDDQQLMKKYVLLANNSLQSMQYWRSKR